MTIEEAKQKPIAWANAQVGYREGANNWNKYAQQLDAIPGLTWGVKQNQPWCAMFCLADFVNNFGVEAALKMLYSPMPTSIPLCREGARYFQEAGAWYRAPQLGDIVFFYVNGEINHQGIVTAVGMGAITTVEGNSSDMVARRTYAIGSSQIAGYGRPNWALAEDAEGNDPVESPQPGSATQEEPQAVSYCDYVYRVDTNLLKLGNYGPQVKNMQYLLNAHGFDCGEADGKFGEKTFAALTAFQSAAQIEVDGEWGGESFRTLWNLN